MLALLRDGRSSSFSLVAFLFLAVACGSTGDGPAGASGPSGADDGGGSPGVGSADASPTDGSSGDAGVVSPALGTCGADAALLVSGNDIADLVLDDAAIYFTRVGGVYRVAKAGGTPQKLAAGLNGNPGPLAQTRRTSTGS